MLARLCSSVPLLQRAALGQPLPAFVNSPRAVSVATSWTHSLATRAGSSKGSGGRQGLTEEERSKAGGTRGAEQAYQTALERLFDLTGQTAFVTGAAQGMGSWIAMGMARCGADVALADIGNEDKLETVAQHVREQGRKALTIKCDVRDRPAVQRAMQQAAEQLGGPDILVANAGILGKLQPADKVSRQVWHDVMETNVLGVYNCARAAYPYMKKAGRGKIIIMSSIAGIRGFGAQVSYCASKGALLPLSKSLAAAWGKDNIQVNCLLPGAINTAMLDSILTTPQKVEEVLSRIPLGRLGVSEDVVGPAVFLASHASDYITGAEIVVDGGGTVLPMVAEQDPSDFKPS